MSRHVVTLVAITAFTWAAERPNIVVVVADDLSPAYLSCYGGRAATPALDRIAQEGVRFDRAFSAAPICNPSRYGLFTGRYASRSPQTRAKAAADAPTSVAQNTRLLATDATLARSLAAVGYRTGHVGKWHSNFEYGPLPKLPTAPAEAADPAIDALLKERTRLQEEAIRRLTGFDVVAALVSGNLETHARLIPAASHHHPEWQTRAALAFIDQAAAEGQPFYLHLANTIPHSPDNLEAADADPRFSRGGILDPLPSDHPARSTIRARLAAQGLPQTGYVASIAAGMLMLDDQMTALRARLAARGLERNTMILFVGDHGLTGKGTCYASGNHVPFLVSWPGGFAPRPAVRDVAVSLIDVVPTVLAAAGAAHPGHAVDGHDLLPLIRQQTNERAQQPVYIEAGVSRSVILGEWQYIALRYAPATLRRIAEQPEAPLPDIFDEESQPFQGINLPYKPGYFDADQLYHLPSDPFCHTNLIHHPSAVAVLPTLRAALHGITAGLPGPFPLETPAVMVTPAYQARSAAQHLAARTAEDARYGYDFERVLNLNLAAPGDVLTLPRR